LKGSEKNITNKLENINTEAICYWFMTGFFLDGRDFQYNINNEQESMGTYDKWYYKPKNISFEKTVTQFTKLFETLVREKTLSKKIILPLSGGLDSRTLAVALRNNKNVIAYSYEFEGGVSETKYAKMIADINGWDFHAYVIPKGYLWEKIDELSEINRCRTEFTHPRQMAVIKQISQLGEINLSGSMGDLLFETFPNSKNFKFKNKLDLLRRLLVSPGGEEIAQDFWEHWKIQGSMDNKFNEVIKNLLTNVNIRNTAGAIRAVKAMHYVKNWTNINMKVFSKYNAVYAPYQDEKMCEFVCGIPENYLSGRKIQIEYIKSKSPALAKVPWQQYDLDLYNYSQFNGIYFPRRVYRFVNRIISEKIFRKNPLIQRNWELQFLGSQNKEQLQRFLFRNENLYELVPEAIIKKYYDLFSNSDSVKYSHPITMLLTFSVWAKRFWIKN